MKADLGAEVRRNPSVCVRYPQNRQTPTRAPAPAVRQSHETRRLPARSGAKARLASENRSARNRTGETSASAAFTTTKVDPQTTVFQTRAASALRRFTCRSLEEPRRFRATAEAEPAGYA